MNVLAGACVGRGKAGQSGACVCVAIRVRVRPLFGGHHLDELLVVHLAVAVDISLPDHLVHLLVRQLLAQVRHHLHPQTRTILARFLLPLLVTLPLPLPLTVNGLPVRPLGRGGIYWTLKNLHVYSTIPT